MSLSAMPQGGPCGNPNPPSWCNGGGGGPCASANPPSWCNQTGVPINNGLWMLMIASLYFFRKELFTLYKTIRKQLWT